MKKVFSFALTALCAAFSLNSCGQAPATLKVVSYNIRMLPADDGDNSWEFRKEATPAMIKSVAPDVFGVQEAFKQQELYILENCKDYKSVGVGRDDGVDKGERMSIFWNDKTVKMKEWGTFWLSETPDVPSKGWDAACRRTATWGFFQLKKSGKEFFYVNTHLDHRGQAARREGLAMIREQIARRNPRQLPMIVTGDFNIRQSDSLIVDFSKVMKNARVTAEQTDSLGTFHGWGKTSTIIDYVFYDGFAACKSYKTLTDSYAGKPYISDHYPIVAVLEF